MHRQDSHRLSVGGPGPSASQLESRMVRVLVLGHIRLYRDALASLIATHKTLKVIGAAPIDDNLPRLVTSERPDIVLVDGASVRGGDLVRRILASVPEASIVAYGILDEEHEAIDCAEAGVAGYVRGDATRDELVATIMGVACGEFRCSPRIVSLMFKRVAILAAEHRETGLATLLTAREKQIVALVDHGLVNKEIASQLGVEVSTVKNHIHNILEKLRVSRRGEAAAAVRRAFAGGLAFMVGSGQDLVLFFLA